MYPSKLVPSLLHCFSHLDIKIENAMHDSPKSWAHIHNFYRDPKERL